MTATPVAQTGPTTGQSLPVQVAVKMVDALGRGDMAGATRDYDATMQKALPADKLREMWGQLIAQNGPFQKRLNSKESKIQGFDVVFINCQFEKETLAIQVTVSPQDNKVSGLFVRPKF